MGLKLTIDAAELAALPTEMRAAYEPDGDGYALAIEGGSDALSKALKAERAARRDAERAAKDAARKLDGLTDDVTAAFEQQAQKLRQQHAAELERLAATVAQTKEAADRARRAAFDAKVDAAGRAAGLHHQAIPDLLRAAREQFRLTDGGELEPIEGRATVGEWLESMKERAQHWWPATGSGAGVGHGSGSSAGGVLSQGMFDAMSTAQKVAAMNAGYRIR